MYLLNRDQNYNNEDSRVLTFAFSVNFFLDYNTPTGLHPSIIWRTAKSLTLLTIFEGRLLD